MKYDLSEFMVLPVSDIRAEDVISNFDNLLSNKNISSIIRKKNITEDELGFIYNLSCSMSNNSNKFFRKKDDANNNLINIWFSLVEKKAIDRKLLHFDSKFEKISINDLFDIAKLSVDVNSVHQIQDILIEKYNIILVILSSFESMKLDGCTFSLLDNTPVIGLSMRYSRYDYFWFTLMHELSHICLHYEHIHSPIFDDLEVTANSDIEIEANRLAADALIPREYARNIYRIKDNPMSIRNISEKYNIHPIIAAGAIRRNYGNYSLFSKLVHSIDLRKELNIDY